MTFFRKGVLVDFTEIKDGDGWELFARDFFAALGMVVEVPPGRGADGGRDLLVSEQMRASLASAKFTWLVSCKHFATGGKSVGTDDEPSIADRLRQHQADGFLGFYSTMASAALVERLRALAEPRPGASPLIRRFEVFDGARITARFHAVGLADVALQHLPEAYRQLRPISPLGSEYEPLPCEVCGEDTLVGSVNGRRPANIIFAYEMTTQKRNAVYVACVGECDRTVTRRVQAQGLIDGWDALRDYCSPLLYLRRLTGFLSHTRRSPEHFSDEAHEAYLRVFLLLAQRTLRQPNAEDRNHFASSVSIEGL